MKKMNLELVKEHIKDHEDEFYCPFSVKDSYLSVFDNDGCTAQFLNLQECNYNNNPTSAGKAYIKSIMLGMKRSKRMGDYNFIKNNIDKFAVETDERNYDLGDGPIITLLNDMFGNVYRTRVVKLPAGGVMPYHKDETLDDHMRILCPIISNQKCINKFIIDGIETEKYLKPNGSFYYFDSTHIPHAVFNESDIDRYILIFTIKKDNYDRITYL